MRPHLLKVPIASQESFSVRRDVGPYFYNRWHYHPEVELLHIEEGSGTQFVGDSIQNFAAGDVLLIGSGLPHYWRCAREYFEPESTLVARSTVVHFREDFWGERFLRLPENQSLAQLLDKARQGIRLHGPQKEVVKDYLGQMLTEVGTTRLVRLMQTLECIATAPYYELLSDAAFQPVFDDADTDRINKIYAYSLANFQRKIPLEEISAVAHLSPTAFCRYFKTRSHKSYSQFLLELRVRHACQLLIEGKLSVAQVCYESGFNQFSGFNKYFKQITGQSPLQYQRSFLGR